MRYLVEEGILNRDGGGRLERSGDTPLAMQIPEGLRDVIGKRMSRLSQECNRVLSVAAVIGRDFSFDVLASVANMPEEAVLAAVEEATKVGVLQEQGGAGPARYRFAHAFFRQTLYEEMIAPRRLRLHQEVARALEARYGGGGVLSPQSSVLSPRLIEHAAELAEHFSYSTDPADLAKAVEYAERAAARASAVYDYGEAVRLLDKALGVQEVLDPEDKAKRCDLLLAYGRALLSAGEPRRAADEVAEEAFALAEGLTDADRACRACYIGTTGLIGYGGYAIGGTPAYRRWAERADAWAPLAGAHRAHAEVYRAQVLIVGDDGVRAWPVLQGALALARQIGDAEALFTAAMMLIVPPHLPEFQEAKLRLVEEFTVTTESRRGVLAERVARLLSGAQLVFLEWGSRPRAEDAQRQLEDLAERTRQPMATVQAGVCALRMRIIDGHLHDAVVSARALQDEFAAAGSSVLGSAISNIHAFRPRLLIGAAADALSAVMLYWDAAGVESSAVTVAQRAVALAHLGRYSEIREEVQGLVTGDSGPGPDAHRIEANVAALLLEATVVGGDAASAKALVTRLSPLASLATSFTTFACPGRLLGGASVLLGEPKKARDFYETALASVTNIRFRPEIALTRFEIAQLLLDHYPAERADAIEHLDFAIGEFREMGMTPALEGATKLRVSLMDIPPDTDAATSIVLVANAVRSEHPDLRRQAAPDGTVTLLFSDIEDSTPLNERLGDAKYMALLRDHNALIESKVHAHRGFVVKTMGDGYMVAFKSAAEGVHCAIAIQAAAKDLAEEVRIRIGLHTGEMTRERDDFFGRHVNLAARVAGHAVGGEILVSGVVHELVAGQGFEFVDGGERAMKGFHEAVRVWVVRS
jgi:eukaryotic-like serine/threonine-protein kinase